MSKLDDLLRELKTTPGSQTSSGSNSPNVNGNGNQVSIGVLSPAEREKNKADRNSIAGFENEADALQQACLQHQIPASELVGMTNNWANKVFTFLGGIDAAWASAFNTANGYTFTHNGLPPEYENIWNFINQRALVLKDIANRIPVF